MYDIITYIIKVEEFIAMDEHYININKCISKSKQIILTNLIRGIIIIILTYIIFRRTNDSFFISIIFIELIGAIVFSVGNIFRYYYVKKIKINLIKNKYNTECNHVIYWSKNNFLLTSNFFCLVSKRKVHIVPYSDIQSIKVEEYYELDSGILLFNLRRFLHIKIRDGQSFKIEMYDSYSKNDDEILEDISPILLDKNRNIIVEPPSKKP